MPCNDLLSELSRIKSLKRDFDLELKKASTTRKIQTAEELKERIEQLAKALIEKLESIDRFIRIRNREVKRNKDFFGEKFFNENIKIPPIPKGITEEMVETWEKQDFRLEYWPRIDMTEDRIFPGWKHRPGIAKSSLPFYDNLQRIQDLFQNKNNPNLIDPNTGKPYKLAELPGAWVLQDTRPKPNFDEGKQRYENDTLINRVLKQLAKQGVLNQEASEGLRNNINPNVFNKPEFWSAIKSALGVESIPGTVARLPRLIEQNYRGQGKDFHETTTPEWAEEILISDERLFCGDSVRGGASSMDRNYIQSDYIGFRPLIVFNK